MVVVMLVNDLCVCCCIGIRIGESSGLTACFRGRFSPVLLCFSVKSVLAAEAAVLLHLESVGIVFLVFRRVVIALLAFRACECNFDSHCKAAPPKI